MKNEAKTRACENQHTGLKTLPALLKLWMGRQATKNTNELRTVENCAQPFLIFDIVPAVNRVREISFLF